jgi:two-component system cell cycle response regulator DivK
LQNPDHGHSHIPIIVLSACAFEADRNAAMDAGASMFMAKPFKPTEVIRNVRQLTINSALGKAR